MRPATLPSTAPGASHRPAVAGLRVQHYAGRFPYALQIFVAPRFHG